MNVIKKRSIAWKNLERQVAKDFGGIRTGARGLAIPDVKGQVGPVQFECKYQKTISLRTAHLEQAKRNARGKPWCLVLRQHNHADKLVVIDYDWFKELYLHRYEEN